MPLLLFFAGCTPRLARPTMEHVRRAALTWPDTTLADLQRGREAYVARCSGCHRLYQPHEEPPERWPTVMNHMAPLARLAAGERQAIERYLVVMASEEGPPAP